MIHADMMQSVHQTPADSCHHQNKDANHNHNQAEHNRLWNSHKNSYTAIFSTDLYNIFMKPYITDHHELFPPPEFTKGPKFLQFCRYQDDCWLQSQSGIQIWTTISENANFFTYLEAHQYILPDITIYRDVCKLAII